MTILLTARTHSSKISCSLAQVIDHAPFNKSTVKVDIFNEALISRTVKVAKIYFVKFSCTCVCMCVWHVQCCCPVRLSACVILNFEH